MAEQIDFSGLGEDTVSPAELRALREAKSFLDLVNADPKARAENIRAYKAKNPNAFIPEHDVAERVKAEAEARIKPIADEMAALNKERQDEKAERFWNSIRTKVSASGLPDGSFDDVQKLMTDQGIANPDVAIAYYKSQIQPKGEQFNWRTTMPGGSDDEKGLLEDPRGWARDKAHQTITELQREGA